MATEFIWHSPDGETEVHLGFDAVDGILHECMRGMGAVPRRGAEVGGVLLGTVAHVGSRRLVTVETFESVPIEYKHGPSYVFSEGDAELFRESMARLNSAGFPHPVGFFRANTRDEMELTEEGYAIQNSYGQGKIPWKDFAKWKADKNIILLYRTDNMFNMVPTRLLQGEAEVQYVLNQLRQNSVKEASQVKNPVRTLSRALVWVLVLVIIGVLLYMNLR